MELITISDKQTLLPHREAIAVLFQDCFAVALSPMLWDWAYIANPNGEPVVSLCYDEGRLVGHYAMVPMPLRAGAKACNSYLSMTTMVATSHRQHGLFVKLAAASYERAIGLGIDFVMGFPNAASTPGFRKRLNWVLPEPDYVAAVSKAQLLGAVAQLQHCTAHLYGLDLEQPALRAWRMARPGAAYTWQKGLLCKSFNGGLDLMYFACAEALESLPDEGTIHVLVPATFDLFASSKAFDYQFGGIALASAFEPTQIKRQMCLSDVF